MSPSASHHMTGGAFMVYARFTQQLVRTGAVGALVIGGLAFAAPVASAAEPLPPGGEAIGGDGAGGGNVTIQVLCIKSVCGDLGSNNGNGAGAGSAEVGAPAGAPRSAATRPAGARSAR